jgi:hypothetical protein
MADPVSATLLATSTALKAGSSIAAGNAAAAGSKYEARQLEENARAATAMGSQEAYDEARHGRMLESDAIAAMAAGGGTSTDAGGREIIGKIGRDTSFNVLSRLFSADREATGIRNRASARRWEGQQAKRQAYMSAASTLISGGSDAFDSYKKRHDNAQNS